MKNFGIIIFLFLGFHQITFAQCFTIESVLADACGDPEGENEMVTLRVNVDLNINNLSFDWPNNTFLNWCPNPATTQQLNQTIISSCGFLLEPLNGIVPTGSTLIVVSSTNMLINANSFEGLSDTIYIIYQCAGNTAGHFSNTSNSPRTLQVNYNGNCVGAQAVSYLPTDLLGGDGAAIFYDTLGQATYYNTGCNAPVSSLKPFWNISSVVCSDYGLIDLNSLLSPNATLGGTWLGDIENNHFFNPTNKLGSYSVTYSLIDTSGCLGASDSTIQIQVENPKFGADTIEVCDSIRQFGIWITEDTILNIEVANPNPFRCDSTVSRFYKINQANFSLNPELITLNSGGSVDFSIIGSNSIFEFWDETGDTCFFPCDKSAFVPENSGQYFFLVKDLNSNCEQLLRMQVNLIYYAELNIPTAFTPNQDGENDFFQIYGKDLSYLNFKIFSSWGEEVFNGTSLQDKWDGKFKNKALSSGIYLLQIEAAGKDGQRFEIVEKIRLIR